MTQQRARFPDEARDRPGANAARRSIPSARPKRWLFVVSIAAAGLFAAACAGPVHSEEPTEAQRPSISNVDRLEASSSSSRADAYRATATAYAAESEAKATSIAGPETEDYGDVVHLLRMPKAERVQIPSLQIDAPVEDVGTEIKNGQLVWKVIADIVGHHRASANPGEPGNMVLTGHVESRSSGNVFLSLPEIQIGDEVIVTSAAGDFTYVVTNVEVRHASETGVLSLGFEEKLTLITCVPDGIYDHRVIVTAKPLEMVASG